MGSEMPVQIAFLGADEQEKWRIVISILQEINAGTNQMKMDIAGLVRDQRDQTKEHSRLSDELEALVRDIDKLKARVEVLEKHKDEVNITIRNAKFLFGGSGIAGLIAWIKGLGG
jgi:septal ring factor EnvC (AmiA/AmiB activator)